MQLQLQGLHKTIFGASILLIFMIAAYNISTDKNRVGGENKQIESAVEKSYTSLMLSGKTTNGLTISELRQEEQAYFKSFGETEYEIMKLSAEMYGNNASEEEIIDYIEKLDKADEEGRKAIYKMSTEKHYEEAKAIIEKRQSKNNGKQ